MNARCPPRVNSQTRQRSFKDSFQILLSTSGGIRTDLRTNPISVAHPGRRTSPSQFFAQSTKKKFQRQLKPHRRTEKFSPPAREPDRTADDLRTGIKKARSTTGLPKSSGLAVCDDLGAFTPGCEILYLLGCECIDRHPHARQLQAGNLSVDLLGNPVHFLLERLCVFHHPLG